MTVELTIQAMYDEYPTLFKERSDCLDQLFCTIGNGYEWINGELVDKDDHLKEKELARHLVDGKAFQHNKMSLRDVAMEYARRREDKLESKPPEIKDLLRKIDEEYFESIPDDVYHEKPRSERWYPISKRFSYLHNYPDDIKPDWLAAIEECKSMLREDGFDIDNDLDNKDEEFEK